MRILYTTDWHLSDRKPDSRTDVDFVAIQLAKIAEVFEIAETNKVDIIYHGGDLFDKGRTSLHIVNKIVPFFKKNKIPFECIIGSHDIIGYNINSLPYTGLGNLLANGYVKLLTKSDIAMGFNCSTVPRVPKGEGSKIIVAHELISPTPLPFLYITLEEVAKENPNAFVFCGHYHKPFMKQVGKTFFFNPGPLVRTSIDEKDIKPSVVYIDTDAKTFEFKALKCAKLGNDVFAVDKANERKLQEDEFQKFIDEVRQKFKEINVEQIVRELAKAQGLDKEVIDVSISLLQE